MATNYVLIDFENVQPANLEVLNKYPFRVLVFVGGNQTKVPFDLASAMQELGESARYIKIAGSGKNSLDFHIAYYIGELAAGEPDAYFHIISRDTGFDPLIKHLKSRKIRVQRESDLAEIPVLRMSNATCCADKIEAIVSNLAGRGQSRPRKIKTLSNTINSLFTDKLSDEQLAALVKELEQRRYIKITNDNVSYNLPHPP
ncbi:MAG: NYN domain-containing protein [Gammaproteobacteria bacterium]|nr:MAG: NYN domain-containing protein [Gammaproteobacteria bacterium]